MGFPYFATLTPASLRTSTTTSFCFHHQCSRHPPTFVRFARESQAISSCRQSLSLCSIRTHGPSNPDMFCLFHRELTDPGYNELTMTKVLLLGDPILSSASGIIVKVADTADGSEIHFAPPQNPWNDDSPVNTNNNRF